MVFGLCDGKERDQMWDSDWTENHAEPLDPELQNRLLGQAKEAGAAGDARQMLSLLVQSRALDGFKRRLAVKATGRSGRDCDPDDVDEALDQAIDILFDALRTGAVVANIAGYLYRVADRKLVNIHRWRMRARVTDPATLAARESNQPNPLNQLADTEMHQVSDDPEIIEKNKRNTAFKIIRQLIPEMNLNRSQQVMTLVVDALESGAEEFTDAMIAETLMISVEAARKARERGVARLKKLAIGHGYSSGALDCIPDESDDEDDADSS
jgi:DNA-directed RNA polymerase specialized sigma24 family protein